MGTIQGIHPDKVATTTTYFLRRKTIMEFTNRFSNEHTEFPTQLEKGKKGERLVKQVLAQRGWEVVDVSNSYNYQRQDVDLRIFRNKKPGLSVEVKTDANVGTTGNIGLLTYNSWNKSRNGDGWFNFTSADLLVVVDAYSNEIYAFNVNELREYVVAEKLEDKKYEIYDGTVIKMFLVNVDKYATTGNYFQRLNDEARGWRCEGTN